ncbi:hypothetical protein AA313_de0204088 [Arthrobotrys entomopaga]|nr:hypothetical protein AA313_de0204088 [Arthrobotrys entomopaga]
MATDRREIDDYDSHGSYSSHWSSEDYCGDNQEEPPTERLCHYHDCFKVCKRSPIPPVIQHHQNDFPVQLLCDNNYLHPFATFGSESVSAGPYLQGFGCGFEHSLGQPLPAGPSSAPQYPPPTRPPNLASFQHSKDCDHYQPPSVSLSKPTSFHCVPPTQRLATRRPPTSNQGGQNSISLDGLSKEQRAEIFKTRYPKKIKFYENQETFQENINFQFPEMNSEDLGNAKESCKDMEDDMDAKYHDLANRLRNMKLARRLPTAPPLGHSSPAKRHKSNPQEENGESSSAPKMLRPSNYTPCNDFYGATKEEKPESLKQPLGQTTQAIQDNKPQIQRASVASARPRRFDQIFRRPVVNMPPSEPKASLTRDRATPAALGACVKNWSDSEEDDLYAPAVKIVPKILTQETSASNKKNETPAASKVPKKTKETLSSALSISKTPPSNPSPKPGQSSINAAPPLRKASTKIAPSSTTEHLIRNGPLQRKVQSSIKPSASTSDTASSKVVAPASKVPDSGKMVSRKSQLTLDVPSIPVAKDHENPRLSSSKPTSKTPQMKSQFQIRQNDNKEAALNLLKSLVEKRTAKLAQIKPAVPAVIKTSSKPPSGTIPAANKSGDVGTNTSTSRPPPYMQNSIIPRKGEVWVEDISLEADAATLELTNPEQSFEGWEVVDEMEGYEQDERDWEAVKQLDRDIPKC